MQLTLYAKLAGDDLRGLRDDVHRRVEAVGVADVVVVEAKHSHKNSHYHLCHWTFLSDSPVAVAAVGWHFRIDRHAELAPAAAAAGIAAVEEADTAVVGWAVDDTGQAVDIVAVDQVVAKKTKTFC